MPVVRAMVVLLVLALVCLVVIFVAMPGTMGSTMTPWEFVRIWVTAAMAGQSEALIVVGLAGSAAVAILVGSIWLSRKVDGEQPG